MWGIIFKDGFSCMADGWELQKCWHCGETYHTDAFHENKRVKCFGCGMELIPLVAEETATKGANEFYALLGYFGIIALVGAVGGIMVAHGWNFWVTFVMLGGIIYLTAKVFVAKYSISRIHEQIVGEFTPEYQISGQVAVFDQLVADAMNELPGSLKNRLSNVSVVIEDQPSSSVLEKLGLMKNKTLLGLFQGIPLNKKSVWQAASMPERITIFQKNIEILCHSDEEIKQKIKEVVRHEVAHFVGFTEGEIRGLGY